jgi:hypothetical protein
MTTLYKFKAYYTDAGVGTAQDPAPTCTVINMADDSKLADAQATTASTNMPGLYSYEYSGADGLDCVAWFKTTDTGCDVKELASYVSEKITTNLNADVAGVETKLDTVDTNVDAILADTGTDGVIVASGTVTTLTNLPAAPTDWLTGAAVKADAVTKLQANLALEATLTAIKGAGWTDETLVSLQTAVEAIDVSGVADAVWDEALAGHAAVGSAGAALAASGSAGDPWSTALPGAYGAGTAGKAIADIVAKTDALDVSDVSFVTSVSGSTITVVRGDTLDDPHLLNIGDLTDYVSIDIMVKRGTGEADDAAIIHIRKNASGLADGLLKLNGAAPALATDGWITIDDVPTGDITPNLKATVTDDLIPGSYVYDVQVIKATNVKTRTTGTWIVTADVTRLVA